MIRLLDYRLVILTHSNKIELYDIEIGKGHDEVLGEFANKYGYQQHHPVYLANQGNSIFYNVGNYSSVAYLPHVLDEERLYTLDYIQNWLDGIQYMEVLKVGKNNNEIFILDKDIKKRFSEEVIQSYYKPKKIK